jgi:hypothetical protein
MGRYITNETGSPMYVGGRLIPPFDGRHFDDNELPAELRVAAAPAPDDEGPSLDEQLQQLRTGSVKVIVDALAGLTFEALERLASLESEAATPRKSLLAAIDAEKLHRASAQLDLEAQQQAEKARHDAGDALLQARVALINLPKDTASADRDAAEARVAEAQAKVDALAPPPAA